MYYVGVLGGGCCWACSARARVALPLEPVTIVVSSCPLYILEPAPRHIVSLA